MGIGWWIIRDIILSRKRGICHVFGLFATLPHFSIFCPCCWTFLKEKIEFIRIGNLINFEKNSILRKKFNLSKNSILSKIRFWVKIRFLSKKIQFFNQNSIFE